MMEVEAPNFRGLLSEVRNQMTSLGNSELHTLRRFVRARLGRVPSADVDEMAQEALTRAWKASSDSHPTAAQLIETAKGVVPILQRERVCALRRGGGVASKTQLFDSAKQAARSPNSGTIDQHRRVRPPRAPHKPKGVARIEYPEYLHQRFDHVRESIGDVPSQEVRAMAARLQKDLIGPVLMGLPVSPKAIRLIRKVHDRLYGNSLESRWAEIVKEELEIAARARLSYDTQKASRAAPVPEPSGPPRAILTVEETLPGTTVPHPREILAEIRPVRRQGDQILAEIVGEFDQKRQVLARCWLSPFDRTDKYDLHAAARVLLLRAIERIAALPAANSLPDPLLDTDFVNWLITRINFDGGGRDKLSSERLSELLKDPLALADEADAFAKRLAERGTDDEAARIESVLRAIAKRLRLAAGSHDAERDAT